MAITIIVTNAGRAALVNAANTGTNAVQIAEVGLSASAITPLPTATSLTGEFKRLKTMSGAVVADDTIHLTVRDESNQSFTVRSFGLYLADGTLFAIYGQAPVLVEKSQQSIMLLAIDVKFADISAASLTFGNIDFLNPPATKSVQGVVELATEDEMKAGTDDVRAATPRGTKAAVTKWTDDRFGAGAPSALAKNLLALALAADIRAALGLKNAALKDEGAGKGLDADLLDGQHGSYYTAIADRLGFTPLNAAHYTAADILAKLLTVDGSGSGIDADRLDGQDGSYYGNIIARLGYTPLNAANYTAADVLAKLLTVDGAGSGIDADRLDGQDGSYYGNIIARLGYTPLNAANYTAADVLAKLLTVDGSGSGLDADFLDGRHATSFLQTIPGKIDIFAMSSAPSGYLECNGAAVSRETYAALFAAIGINYGAGDQSTTFNLPDLRGEFIRGWDHGRGIDMGRSMGSHQMDALQQMKGTITSNGRGQFSSSGNTGVFSGQGYGTARHGDGSNLTTRANLDFDASHVARTATETRPRNIAMLICIKT